MAVQGEASKNSCMEQTGSMAVVHGCGAWPWCMAVVHGCGATHAALAQIRSACILLASDSAMPHSRCQ